MIYRLDENGFLICEYAENYPHFKQDWVLITTDKKPNSLFFKNKWNGTDFVEGATSEEITTNKAKELTERINKAFTFLRQRALSSSIGKSLEFGFEYIKEQADQYIYKYEVAIGNIEDSFVNSMIDNEAIDFGITTEKMRELIIDRYLQGKGYFMAYSSMIERGRTKALTMIEINDLDKAEQIVVLMENVPETLNMQEAELLTNQMLSI